MPVTVPLLILVSDQLPGGRVELTARQLPVVLGRSHTVDLTISDTQLSRRHAEINVNSAGQFELTDLDSTNLTIVNTHDVARHILKTGDEILLGDTEIRVEVRLPQSDIHDQTTKDLPLIS
jgi:pSer/pThr/pTyr-binding forkhead associated (FHA) protein